MVPPSAHSISAAAIPAGYDGRTDQRRQSLFGAVMAAKEAVNDGTLLMMKDSLRVSPQSPGDVLWEWVQPLLSAGGHILGAPIEDAPTTEKEALEMGFRILLGIYDGRAHAAKRPEHSIPVLLVLASMLQKDKPGLASDLTRHLKRVVRYASEPALDQNMGIEYDKLFKDQCKYTWIKEALDTVDLHLIRDNGEEYAPSWKEIKRSFERGGCSNKKARFIRRVMISYWPKKYKKMHIATLRRECIAPIPSNHPVLDYIERCWMLRTSSISSHLVKRPPDVVKDTLQALGLTRESDEVDVLRAGILQKFQIFQEWVIAQHGPHSSPSTWSDTLSKFASSINPAVKRYNLRVGSFEVMEASSFVPGDLAPEMYSKSTNTGYFFMNCGMCYSYSKAWRRDAFVAFIEDRLPSKVSALSKKDRKLLKEQVSIDLAYDGGSKLVHAIKEAGVTELEFTQFLRQYYWAGAFLKINLAENVNKEGWEIIPMEVKGANLK